MIYHYCSVPVMEKIIATKEVWMSDITKMNDEGEYKSGYSIIQEILSEFDLEHHDIVNEMSSDKLNETFQILIGCFSKNGDLKSQWLEYADQAKGVSIGFDERDIKQFNLFNRYIENDCEPITNSVDFIPVNYDEVKFRESARNIINRYIQSRSIIKWQLLARHLMYLSISYKDSFFKEEDEIRAVITLESRFNEKYLLEKRDTKLGETNYHRLNTSYEKFSSIKKIIIGPKCTLTINDVQEHLEKYNLAGVQVINSIATGKYR